MDTRSRNRLAHIGDRIISLAICQVLDEAGSKDDVYFSFQSRLSSNANFASVRGKRGGTCREAGTKEEAQIGRAYFRYGLEQALDEARSFIKLTKVWKELEALRATAAPIAQPAPQSLDFQGLPFAE